MATINSKPYGYIYLVTHRESGKMYVGQTTTSIAERWAGHQRCNYCARLHRAIKKHGPDAFDVQELDFADSKEDLDNREIFWISLIGTRDRSIGYNLMSGGSFGKHSDESKKKMSDAVRAAHKRDPGLSERRARPRVGKPLPEKTRRKISQSNTGKTASDDARSIMAAKCRARWEDDAFANRLIAAQNKGKESKEYLANASMKAKAQWSDPEKRESMCKAIAAGHAAFWADPEKRAARIAKRAATIAAKKLAK